MLYLFLALVLQQPSTNAPPADSPDTPPTSVGAATDEPPVEAPDFTQAELETATGEAPEDSAKKSKFRKWLEDVLDSGAIGLLRDGGFFMWPSLIMGIVGAGVIIERYRSLKMLRTDSGEIRSTVSDLLGQDRVKEALDLCDREQGPVPAILSAGLRKFFVMRRLGYDEAKVEEQVVKGMDDHSVHIVAALERHLPILATISSVAPMLGFLGTVQGMIVAFTEIEEKIGTDNIVKLAAGGIQVALLTTCLGLIVGIPAFIAFNYFTSVINGFVLEVEESATELMENVTLQMALEKHEKS